MKDNTKWFVAVVIVLSLINWVPVYLYYTNIGKSSPYSAHAELQSQALLDMQQDMYDFEYRIERALNSSIGDMTDRINRIESGDIVALREELDIITGSMWRSWGDTVEELRLRLDRLETCIELCNCTSGK